MGAGAENVAPGWHRYGPEIPNGVHDRRRVMFALAAGLLLARTFGDVAWELSFRLFEPLIVNLATLAYHRGDLRRGSSRRSEACGVPCLLA